MRLGISCSQTLDERVKASIFRYNVTVCRSIAHRQHADIEGNMQTERIRAITSF